MSDRQELSFGCDVRPARIAFAIDEGDLLALREVIQITTQLWGGIFNPIFFKSAKNRTVKGKYCEISEPDYESELQKMLYEFDPDVIFNWSLTPLPASLKNFTHRTFDKSKLYWNPWGERSILFYLEVWPFLHKLWRDEFRFAAKAPVEIHFLDTQVDDIFLLTRFGLFSQESKGNDLLKTWFGASQISYDEQFRKSFKPNAGTSPIGLTALQLRAPSPSILESYIFLALDTTDIFDIVDYWNLRASGTRIFTLPLDSYRDFEDGVKSFAEIATFNINAQIINHTTVVKSRSIDDDKFDEMAVWLRQIGINQLSQKGWFTKYGERGYRIAPELSIEPTVSSNSTVSVHLNSGFGSAEIDPPKCDFIDDARSQHWYADLLFYGLTSDNFCYRLPWPSKAGDSLANSAVGTHFELRSSHATKQGIATVHNGNRGNLLFRPMPVQNVIKGVFEECGLKLIGSSNAGLAASRIIEHMGGIHNCDFFQNRGVRRVLELLAGSNELSADKLRQIVYKSTPEDERKKIPALLDFLVDKQVLRAGFNLQCQHCQRRDWYHFGSLRDHFQCRWCFTDQKTPRLDQEQWRYRSDGLFQLKNRLEGCITVILANHFLHLYAEHPAFMNSFNVKDGEQKFEIDFGIINSEFLSSRGVDIVIGEAKSFMALKKDEIDKVSRVGQRINAYLCFCTLAEMFSAEDQASFRELVQRRQKLILLTAEDLDLPIIKIMTYQSDANVIGTKIEALSKLTTIKTLGKEFAHEQKIWL